MLEHALIVIASFLVSVVLTPLVKAIAIRWNIVDRPDGHRKLHGRVIARAGGTAVLFSVLVICSLALFRYDVAKLSSSHTTPYIALFAAMVGIWLIGLADDIWTLRGRQKLAGQFVLAAMLVFAGFQIQHVQFMGLSLDLGRMAIPVSILWLLATTNALNLIDGSDGLCSALGAVICGSLGVLAATNGHFAEAAIAFSLCGALIGFLVFNFPPASIFLGDSGSLLVGLVAGALAIRCSLKGPATVAFLAPMTILFLPLLDSAMAIVRRKMTGRSIYTTDRAHMHHVLKNKGLGDRGLLLTVTTLALITSAGALLSQALGREWLAPVGVAVVFLLLVVTKTFGYAELLLIARRGSHFALSFLESRTDDVVHQRVVRLQGSRKWETVWQTLVEFAEDEELSRVHMDLNVPWLEEGFHGTWQRSRIPDRVERWTTSIPIYASGRITGRVDVVGLATPASTFPSLSKLLELLQDLTPLVENLIDTPVSAIDAVTAVEVNNVETKIAATLTSANR